MGNINFVNTKNSDVTIRHYVGRFIWEGYICCTVYTTVLKLGQGMSIPNNINEFFTVEGGDIKTDITPDIKEVKNPLPKRIENFNVSYALAVVNAVSYSLILIPPGLNFVFVSIPAILYNDFMVITTKVNNFYSKTTGNVFVEIV